MCYNYSNLESVRTNCSCDSPICSDSIDRTCIMMTTEGDVQANLQKPRCSKPQISPAHGSRVRSIFVRIRNVPGFLAIKTGC
jgi:hypothetical protein